LGKEAGKQGIVYKSWGKEASKQGIVYKSWVKRLVNRVLCTSLG